MDDPENYQSMFLTWFSKVIAAAPRDVRIQLYTKLFPDHDWMLEVEESAVPEVDDLLAAFKKVDIAEVDREEAMEEQRMAGGR